MPPHDYQVKRAVGQANLRLFPPHLLSERGVLYSGRSAILRSQLHGAIRRIDHANLRRMAHIVIHGIVGVDGCTTEHKTSEMHSLCALESLFSGWIVAA